MARAVSRRQFLAGAGVAATASLGGCSMVTEAFDSDKVTAELTDGYGMEIADTGGGGTLGGPWVVLEVTLEFVRKVDFLAVMDDGEQASVARLGTRETTGKVFVDEGYNWVIGIQGGEYDDSKVFGGEPIIEGFLEVEVA